MKTKILLAIATVAFLASCSTFKAGHTPDDVYYSETKVWSEEDSKKDITSSLNEYNYEDRALRMSVRHGRRWSTLESPYYFDNFRYDCNCNCNWYGYSPFGFYGNRVNYFWNGGIGYNGWYGYNYYAPVFVTVPSKPKYIAPRGGTYSGRSYSNTRFSNNNTTVNSKSNGGGLLNRVFSSGDNIGSSGSPRAYSPSSSSSGSGSSGGGVSRPARSGN